MANILQKVQQIRQAIFGKEVRESIASGIESINAEVESTTAKQEHLESTFDQLVINAGSSNSEIVDARVDKITGKSYTKVGERMDEVSSQLADIPNQVYITEKAKQVDLNRVNDSVVSLTNTKAEKEALINIQKQVNNLVLVSDGTQNAEVVQARGSYPVLDDRLVDIGVSFEDKIINPTLYELDIVKNFMQLTPIIKCDLKQIYKSGTWKYEIEEITLPVGTYTCVIKNMKLSSVGYFSISPKVTEDIKFLDRKTKSGVYVFNVYNDGLHYTGNVFLKMQVANAENVNAGVYCVNGISIYRGDITKEKVFPDYITGNSVKLDKVLGKNLFNKNSKDILYHYYINKNNGKAETNQYIEPYYASGFIPAKEDNDYILEDYNLASAGIGFYSSRKEFISGLNGTNDLNPAKGKFRTPIGTAYIRITGHITKIDTNQLLEGTVLSTYEPYTEFYPVLAAEKRIETLEKKQDKILVRDIINGDRLSDSQFIQIDVPSIKRNHTIAFRSRINAFNKIRISHEETFVYASAYVDIDNTNISICKGSITIETIPHGLTISNFIDVVIKVLDNATADIIITTIGGVYKKNIAWNGCMGVVKATSIGCELTECSLTYYCADLKKDIWAFGDSYFDMWPQYLNEWGYKNIMLDGRSGRGSVEALQSLNKCLVYKIPKMILWCLGMNDADSSTAINANWKTTLDSLIVLCNEKGIELILMTIPTTPTQNHTFKNAYVKASGKRYVDINNAVGADISTSWYSGLLSSDNVHPVIPQGARVIASRVVTDVPEIM